MRQLAAILLFSVLPALAQHDHSAMQHRMHHTSDATLSVNNDEAAHMLEVRIGPVNLPANTDHMQAEQPREMTFPVLIDGWITAYHPRLVDKSGQPVPNRLLHHVAFYNAGRSDFLCSNKEEHIFGAGGEMNDWPTLPGFGYRVRAGDKIRISTMFHNPTSQDYPETFLDVKIEYQLASDAPLKSVYPAWFDVKECADSAFDLGPGKTTTSGQIKLRYNGVLLGVGGHLHDYGTGVKLEDVTHREMVADLPSKLDSQGHILSMPIAIFADRGGFRLHAGDELKTSAAYDNPQGKVLPDGAMGIVVGYFLPDDDAQMAGLARKPRTSAVPSRPAAEKNH